MRGAAILATMALASLPCRAELDISFDRFSGQTTIVAPKQSADEIRYQGAIRAFTSFKGERPAAVPKTVLVSYTTVNSGWRYLRCPQALALVDGRPFPLPAARHTGDVIAGDEVLESLSFELPWARFKALASAEKIEFKFCNDEVPVDESRRDDWRALIKAATP